MMANTHRYATKLTDKQKEYLHYAAQGLTNKQIAKELGISLRATITRCESIQNMLGFLSKQELVAYAQEHDYGKEQA